MSVSVSIRHGAWGMWQALRLPYPSMLLATTMSVFQLPIALASHACAPLSLVAGCDTLPSPAPVVATSFGQITCFKIPLAKPSQGNKPTQANEAKELSFSYSALSRDMRPPTVPVQPASNLDSISDSIFVSISVSVAVAVACCRLQIVRVVIIQGHQSPSN